MHAIIHERPISETEIIACVEDARQRIVDSHDEEYRKDFINYRYSVDSALNLAHQAVYDCIRLKTHNPNCNLPIDPLAVAEEFLRFAEGAIPKMRDDHIKKNALFLESCLKSDLHTLRTGNFKPPRPSTVERLLQAISFTP